MQEKIDSIYKYPKWMNIYNKIDKGESLFHSGFLYGFIIFFIASNVLTISTIYTDIGLLLGYLVVDQIIYRMFILKRKKCDKSFQKRMILVDKIVKGATISSMKVRYYTFDKQGIVTKHYIFITAFIKVLFQALILGVDSSIDKMYHSKGYYKTIFKISGWRPFRKKMTSSHCLKAGVSKKGDKID